MSEARSRNRTRGAKATRKRTAEVLRVYAPAVAFARDADNRHALTDNANRAKRHLQVFDRDSATAKRDGTPTQGARLARKAPLGSRAKRYGNARIPSLPLGKRSDAVI